MKKTFKVATNANFIAYVEADTMEMAEALVNKTFALVKGNKPADVKKIFFNGAIHSFVECAPLMDTTNGHDAELVKRINDAYILCEKTFKQIVKALAIRDAEEFLDATGFNPEDGDMDEVSFYYCRRVADDKDLETILSFCRR